MFQHKLYRNLAAVVMISIIAVMLIHFVGFPIMRWYQTYHAINLAKQRLDLLRVDMNPDEVKSTLGLSSHFGSTRGGGPPQSYYGVTDLGYGHHLSIIRNVVDNPARLV